MDHLLRRLSVVALVVVLLVASALVIGLGSVPARPSVPSAGPVKASVLTPTIYYNYSDFFNVPYGEWWDLRTPKYGDEPVDAQCFNATGATDGWCKTSVPSLPRVAQYPYMDWAGSGTSGSEGSSTSIFAPYRVAVNGLYIPGYNLSQPVFLPVLDYAAAPGNTLSFNWNMQYMNKADFTRVTSTLGCFSGTGTFANEGYQLINKIYLTMDNEEALRLFGATIPTGGNLQSWWTTNTATGCGHTKAQFGPLENTVDSWFSTTADGKYDINNGYAAPYTSLYTNITANVLSSGPTGLTQVYIEHGAWGTESLLSRWFYWGNASYAGNQADSSKAQGWWGMENGWWEGLHYAGKLQTTTMNFNLTGVLQYHFQERSLKGPDGVWHTADDTPYWTWGPELLDYVPASKSNPYSELNRFSGLNYIKTTPGSGDYGTNTSFDYVPVSWAAKAQEYWKFVFPTNTSAYYQNPATATLGTDPFVTGAPLPTITSSLALQQIFPAGYGTWNAATGTWTVTGGTPESWPTSIGPGHYPYIPYPGIYLHPAGVPPSVTTNAASGILGSSATLNGDLVSLGTASTVTVGFLYSTDPGLASPTNHSLGTHGVGAFSYTTTFTPGTVYYFAAWANGAGFTLGSIETFTAGVYPPTVTTNPASAVKTTTATLNGNLADLGSAGSVTVGFLWGTASDLTGATNTTPVTETATGPFTSAIASLTPGTVYYFAAWAYGARFVQGSTLSFTAVKPPTVATVAASAITTVTATLNGDLSDLGTVSTVTVGFLWGTDASLATSTNDTLTPMTLAGTFTDPLVGLTPGTTYYFEAWANGQGFSMGTILSFTTLTPPSVTTTAATVVGSAAATVNGNLASLGSAASVTVGFLWGTSSALTGATNTTPVAQTAIGAFSDGLTGLTASTTYYFQAWANGDAFATGSIMSFTTSAPPTTPPSVTTVAATSVSTTAATANGNLASLGSASSVNVGFLWGTSSTLATATNTTPVAKTSTGSFASALTGLTPGTTYYFEAWANGAGFAHGTILSFATGVTPPAVASNAASGLTTTAATLNGATSTLGTAASVSVGFLYGTSSTLGGATNGSAGSQTAAGSFSLAVTGLTPGTTYYFAAWAVGNGFVEGTILSFATTALPSPPSVTTVAATGITTAAAALNGNVVGLGTASSVTVGFLWGTDSALAGATNVTVGPQTATGTFTSTLSSLTPGTTYYFEAWVVGVGFAHGTILSFTTQAAPPSEATFLGLPAMLGYAVLALIVIVIVAVLVVILFLRRRKKSPPANP